CHDWYSETYYAESPAENPHGPGAGKMRVLRGGAWDCTAEQCRSAYRHKEFPVYSDACFGADSYGFRRARNAEAGNNSPSVTAATPKTSEVSKTSEVFVAKPAPVVRPAPSPGKLDVAGLKGTIVFVSDRSGTMKIWTMHASGKSAKQLTKGSDA